MKRFIPIVLLVALAAVVFVRCASAQRENNWWCSGSYWLNFNDGQPADTIRTNSVGGAWTISNRLTGTMLFHLGLGGIYTRLDQPMEHNSWLRGINNGPFDGGDLDYYNIIPFTSFPNKYLALETNGWSDGLNKCWLQYSLVDMLGDGGKGDCDIYNVVVQHNASFKAVTWHHNGCDIWIVCHSALGNTFWSYLLTPQGINAPPVVSRGGIDFKDWPNTSDPTPGALIFDPTGTHLLLGSLDVPQDPAVLFNFDNRTGIVTDPIMLPDARRTQTFEFSPSGKRLYVLHQVADSGEVVQYDVSIHDDSTINASETRVYPVANGFHKESPIELFTGPNEIMYVCQRGNNLGAITHPDLLGAGCGYQDSVFRLAVPKGYDFQYKRCLIESSADCPYHQGKCDSALLADFISRSAGCSANCVSLLDRSTLPATSWLWSAPGAKLSDPHAQYPTACYDSVGDYPVTLIADSPAGRDTIIKMIRVPEQSGVVKLKHTTDTTLGTNASIEVPIDYTLPLGFVGDTLSCTRITYELNYDQSLLVLPMSEAAQRISLPVGWQFESIDSSDGKITITIGDTCFLTTVKFGPTYVHFEIADSMLHLGKITFMTRGNKHETATIKLGYARLCTSPTDYLFCDNVEMDHIAQITVRPEAVSQSATHLGSWSLHPDPAHRQDVTLKHAGGSAVGSVRLKVYDLLGREKWSGSFAFDSKNQVSIPTSDFVAGTYLLRIEDSEGSETIRFEIQ